jgi:hypothetical protein
MSYTAIAIIGFLALIGIVAYFLFFRQGVSSASGLPTESALIASERANTFDTSRSVSYGEESFNYTNTSTNYAYYSGA